MAFRNLERSTVAELLNPYRMPKPWHGGEGVPLFSNLIESDEPEIVNDPPVQQRPRVVKTENPVAEPTAEEPVNFDNDPETENSPAWARSYKLPPNLPTPGNYPVFRNITEGEGQPLAQNVTTDAETEEPPPAPTGALFKDAPKTRQRIAGDPLDWKIEQIKRWMYDDKLKNAPENKPNRWKAGAMLAMKHAGDVLMRGGSWADAIGAAGGAFAGGAINPKAFADLKHGNILAYLYQKRAEQRREEDRQIGNAYRRAQIANMMSNIENREFDNNLSEDKFKEQTLREITKNGFDPDNVSPAQLERLRRIGYTPQMVGKVSIWGDTREIGGLSFKFNKATGAYEPTNLPENTPKKFTTITVKDIDGNESTYTVPEVKAAEFKTQMSVLGAQVKRDEIKSLADIKRRNAEKRQRWEEDKRKAVEERNKIATEIAEKETQINQLKGSNNVLREELQKLDPENEAHKTRINQINDQIKQNDTRFFTLTGEIEGLRKREILDPPEPQYEPETVNYPTVSGSTGQVGSVSESVFRQRLIVNGITAANQQKALIEKAKADGIVK